MKPTKKHRRDEDAEILSVSNFLVSSKFDCIMGKKLEQ